jgi:hypothetical protein
MFIAEILMLITLHVDHQNTVAGMSYPLLEQEAN